MFPIDIPEDGQVRTDRLIAQAPDYGDYTALLDGKPMNLDQRQAATSEIPLPGPEVIYNYLAEVYVARDRALGMVDLTKGRHTLTFVCTGKDSHSSGYNFGINDVVLEKMPDLTEAQVAEAEAAISTSGGSAGPVYRGRPLTDYLRSLKSASGAERIKGIYAIGEFGADGAAGIPALNTALADADANVRAAAASSLAKIGKGDSATVQALMHAFEDSESRVRIAAALALKSIGPNAAPAVTPLIAALKGFELTVRLAAAQALGAIGPKAADAVPALAAIVVDKNEGRFMFRTAMIALGEIGPGATAAIPILREIAAKRPDSTAAETILLIEGRGKEARTYY